MVIQSLRGRLPHIYILYFECIKITRKKKNYNTDVNTIYGNKLISVAQKAYFPYFLSLSATDTMNNKNCINCKYYFTPESLGEMCMPRV